MSRRRLVLSALLAASALGATATTAGAETAVGVIRDTGTLVTLDTAAPGTFTSSKPITGLEAGESIIDVDFRYHPSGESPPPPQLFGLALKQQLEDVVRLYSIDIETGVATPVGAGVPVAPVGNTYGIDFNSGVDRLRVVNDLGANRRLSPSNGAAFIDTNISPAGEKISGVAYDRVDFPVPLPVGSTTAFAIGVTASELFTLGSANGIPTSPNTGILSAVGPLGVTLTPNKPAGFDISRDGTAFATLVVGGQPGLYTINLETGAATLVGTLPETLSGFALAPLSVKGPPPPPAGTTAPTIAIAGVKKTLSFAAFLKGISARVTPSEPASLAGELLGPAKKTSKRTRLLAAYTRTLAMGTLPLAAGQRTLKLKPRRKLVGRPSKAFRVQLRVTATDAAGNAGAATMTIKVKPPKPPKAKASRSGSSPGRR